jgi:predicted amidohydrolase YtcJ
MLTRSVASIFALAVALSAQAPDLIIHNAKLVTVDPQFRIVQAMAVRGDRIVAVGTNADVLARKGANTKIVDAGGQTVLPGLMDSHVHAAGASMYEFDHEIPTMETIADVLRYIKSRAAVVPKGEWISLSQVFITRLREQRYPTSRHLLHWAGCIGEHAGAQSFRDHKGNAAATGTAGQSGAGSKDGRTDGHSPYGIAVRESSPLDAQADCRGPVATAEDDARRLQFSRPDERRRAKRVR